MVLKYPLVDRAHEPFWNVFGIWGRSCLFSHLGESHLQKKKREQLPPLLTEQHEAPVVGHTRAAQVARALGML